MAGRLAFFGEIEGLGRREIVNGRLPAPSVRF
jgi:hypothetical protein